MPITIPIIENLVHPNVGRLSRTALAGNPYAGPFIALAPPQPPLGAFPTYGIVLSINAVGVAHGRDVSFPVEYQPPLGKICSTYTDLSSTLVILQRELWLFDDQWYVWSESLPSLVTIYLQPDVSANLFWLHT